MLFFHGNAEDIGIARRTLIGLKSALKISILAVEYCGYGLFQGEKDADKVLHDCLSVFDYLTCVMGVAHEDILLFGRSIGSSPSCFIAQERPNVGALILMSPFKSLREIARDHVGKLLSYLLAERYRNIDLITRVRCPALIIHGQKDMTIDVNHAQALQDNCGSLCKLVIREEMDHNIFNFQEDLVKPIKCFLKENKIRLHRVQEQTKNFYLPMSMFLVPKSIYDFDQIKRPKQAQEMSSLQRKTERLKSFEAPVLPPHIKCENFDLDFKETDQKSLQFLQNTPCKFFLNSFNLSPHSVKQSVEGGTTIQNSNSLQISNSQNGPKLKIMLQYNYQLYGSQELGNPNNTQSYIDLLNDKSIRESEPCEFNQLMISSSEQNDYLYEQGNIIDDYQVDCNKPEHNIVSSRQPFDDLKLFNKVQYRTQKQSRDFSQNGNNNLIRQIRQYKAARKSDIQGRFMSMPCDGGALKIRNKKLCSPISCKKFENEEIPQSDEQKFVRKQKIFEKNLKNKKTFSLMGEPINESSVLEEFEDKENVDINTISFNLMKPNMIFDTCQGLPTYQTTKAHHGATTTQTIGTGFVTAIDTYTYDNEPSNLNVNILGNSTYALQKEAMQKNQNAMMKKKKEKQKQMMSKILKEVEPPQIMTTPAKVEIMQLMRPQSQEIQTKPVQFWRQPVAKRKRSWFGCFKPNK